MTKMKTPGVYLLEKDAFPNSVVQVPTAVPAFIGYTKKAENGKKSLLNKPFRVSSLAEYTQYFGRAPEYKFEIQPTVKDAIADLTVTKKGYTLKRKGAEFRLFDAIRLFYQNGGGPCYIVSVGEFSEKKIEADKLIGENGLVTLEKEQEPTIVLVPDALSLEAEECYSVYQQVLAHCEKMMSRIAILDVYNGYKDRKDPSEGKDVIEAFREGVGTYSLKYGAAYYPWVETTIVQKNEISFSNLTDESLNVLQKMLMDEKGFSTINPPTDDSKAKQMFDVLNSLPKYKTGTSTLDDIDKSLIFISEAYNNLIKEIQRRLNILPVASAIAGIYTMVDNTRGVWKAPANVSLNGIVCPTVNINHEDQEDLNMPLNGKAVNAIRSFIGEGVIVWGARTLDGNSQDWRYINVRRTVIMLEQSIKAAAIACVFEPNDAGTWTTVKSMIENFLNQQWKSGALAGSKPEDAYSVHVGLGDMMTADDILNGIMRITVLIAVSRPGEFIEITFQQQMQKS